MDKYEVKPTDRLSTLLDRIEGDQDSSDTDTDTDILQIDTDDDLISDPDERPRRRIIKSPSVTRTIGLDPPTCKLIATPSDIWTDARYKIEDETLTISTRSPLLTASRLHVKLSASRTSQRIHITGKVTQILNTATRDNKIAVVLKTKEYDGRKMVIHTLVQLSRLTKQQIKEGAEVAGYLM